MSLTKCTYRLCIYCRVLEFTDEPCGFLNGNPQILPDDIVGPDIPVSGLLPRDAELIRKLQGQPSALCDRCARNNPLKVLTELQPLEHTEGQKPTPGLTESLKSRIFLGQPSSLLLTPSCQFCRILYCVVPRRYEPKRYDGGGMKSARVVRTGEPDIYLEPRRSYLQMYGWEKLSEDTKNQHAVILGLFTSALSITIENTPLEPGTGYMNRPLMLGPVIALESRFAMPDRTLNNLQPIENPLDFSILKRALDNCLLHHGGLCHLEKPAELSTTRMIDISNRTVVSCPTDCDYTALSYVWGGIQPVTGALENKCLPQTIEDAITVTKALGKRYLWVDALCIDQSPNPTPAQMAAKIKQLDMMSTIYGCATVTIVAVMGKNANAGLPGVSIPRLAQVKETIDGRVLFTSPQHFSPEVQATTYSTRAWTLQEYLLSRRSLIFTSSMVVFSCLGGDIEERMDMSTLPSNPPSSPHPMQLQIQKLFLSHPDKQGIDEVDFKTRMTFFGAMLGAYTSRNMTNEGDSLNAFRGVLPILQKQLFPDGFVHGLPLCSHTFSLGWMHSRNSKPKRRAQFPSWSWTGWEGTAIYPEKLIDTSDGNCPSTTHKDLEVHYLASNHNYIDIEGWCVDIDIRTEPFSELFILGYTQSIGTVKEGDCRHNNTLKTGRYHCLVIQRLSEKIRGRDSRKETAFLLALENSNHEIRRKALLVVTLFSGQSFDRVKRMKRIVRLS
ncbi:heterokaryon incompatibility protein-domain-containing protein [Xylaria cf. heliscus]|nr:heterokaryon incompatibility protein-domain-containing protein [Xylaria cf. heliscus]